MKGNNYNIAFLPAYIAGDNSVTYDFTPRDLLKFGLNLIVFTNPDDSYTALYDFINYTYTESNGVFWVETSGGRELHANSIDSNYVSD